MEKNNHNFMLYEDMLDSIIYDCNTNNSTSKSADKLKSTITSQAIALRDLLTKWRINNYSEKMIKIPVNFKDPKAKNWNFKDKPDDIEYLFELIKHRYKTTRCISLLDYILSILNSKIWEFTWEYKHGDLEYQNYDEYWSLRTLDACMGHLTEQICFFREEFINKYATSEDVVHYALINVNLNMKKFHTLYANEIKDVIKEADKEWNNLKLEIINNIQQDEFNSR